MTPFQGPLFFYILGLMLLPAVALGIMGKPLKRYGLLFTAVMLSWIYSENGQLLFLAGFYLWQTALCFLYRRFSRSGTLIFRLAAALSLLPLLAVKLGDILSAMRGLQMLGISYMTFRAVQVLIGLRDGREDDFRLPEFSYFLLFFPSAASGPIDRYRRFVGDLNRSLSRSEYLELARRGFWRLVTGVFSGVIVSGLIWRMWLSPLPDRGLLADISYMYGYTLYLFFNFAGYSSMAIGVSYILGISLPENFNMPFLSVDMKDFWSRWHISLSTWLRDYVYTRFVMDSLKKRRFKSRRTASYIGYILTMTAMGAWHGLTPAYLLYGTYHAALLCVNEALDLHWKQFRKIKHDSRTQVAAAVVTFHLFSFGLLIFSGRMFL